MKNQSRAILFAGLQMLIYVPLAVVIYTADNSQGWQGLVLPLIVTVIASLLLWLPFVETIREKGQSFIREHFTFHMIMPMMLALFLIIARPELAKAGLIAFPILTAYCFPVAGALTFTAAFLAIKFPLKFK